MKTVRRISSVLIMGVAVAMLLFSCEDNNEVKQQEDILPSSFSVDIPSSISNTTATGGRINGRVKGDTLQGNDIYRNLNTFIAVGEEASKLVEAFIGGIRKYHIDRIMTLSFTSDDDHRAKNLVVSSEVTYENKTWDYQLTVTDADSETQSDGGKALQIFWNKVAPVKGIAIIKPYNCDRVKNANIKDAIFRIDYSEEGGTYDAQMEVRIAGLPLGNPVENSFAISTLRMFAGKKGDVVDVYGNSNHPNARLFSTTTGFNWAFVAAGNETKGVGVAEVGLPPSTLNSSSRTVLLKDYSIKNVFTTGITAAWPGINQTLLAAYLSTTAAPGYFNNQKGFLSGGTSPGADWTALVPRMDALSPYNPIETSNLQITFK